MESIAERAERLIPEQKPPLLIAGVDPGTATGIAALTVDGECVLLGSGKELGEAEVVRRLANAGLVVVLGSDKRKGPGFVEKISARFGARLVLPAADLSLEEKRRLCSLVKADPRNDHESDALASAAFAYQEVRGIIAKVRRQLSALLRMDAEYAVMKTVLTTDGLSIKNALELLDRPGRLPRREQPKRPVAQAPQEEKRPPSPEEHLHLRKENRLLRERMERLEAQVDSLGRKQEGYREQLRSRVDDVKAKRLLAVKEDTVGSLRRTLKHREDEMRSLRKKLSQRDHVIAEASRVVVMKRLKNLTRDEWQGKKAVLMLQKGDIILVDDPNTASDDVLSEIAGRCETLVYLTPPKTIASTLLRAGFTLLDGRPFQFRFVGAFAIVQRPAFERERARQVHLDTLVSSYREERSSQNM